MDMQLGWLVADLSLNENGILPRSLRGSSARLLYTVCRQAAQKKHNYFGVKDGESPKYFTTVTEEVNEHFNVSPGSHLYVHYGYARKMVSR